MLILMMRHGPAGNSEAWVAQGKKDSERPLSPEGRVKTRKTVLGLKTQVEAFDLIVTSPYARSKQTADILGRIFDKAKLIENEILRPGTDPEQVISWLRTLRKVKAVALIGHEPSIGMIASRLLSAKPIAFLRFKKGACALLEIPAPIHAGRAVLHWLAQPGQLRRMRGVHGL